MRQSKSNCFQIIPMQNSIRGRQEKKKKKSKQSNGIILSAATYERRENYLKFKGRRTAIKADYRPCNYDQTASQGRHVAADVFSRSVAQAECVCARVFVCVRAGTCCEHKEPLLLTARRTFSTADSSAAGGSRSEEEIPDRMQQPPTSNVSLTVKKPHTVSRAICVGGAGGGQEVCGF